MTRKVSLRVFAAVGFALGITTLGALAVRLQAADLSLDMVQGAAGKGDRKPQREWRLVDGKHWQIVGGTPEDPAVTDAAEGTRGDCAPGMVEVKGNMKTDGKNRSPFDPKTIEEQQKRTCTKWITRDYPERCAEFDRDAWLKLSKDIPTTPMHFCMDRFEFPNIKGVYPIIHIAWFEAAAKCKDIGKRLCNEDEWTFACEGEEATPYPYGYVRSPEKCVIDANWRAFNEKAMRPRDGYDAMLEMDKLWQGVASGSRPECKSVFGVYDMTGNIDEWTQGTRGDRVSILKGGYWGPVRTRCRPSTRSHDENHVFYQQGFRCCTDAPTPGNAPAVNYEAPSPTSVDPSRPTGDSGSK
ncbi:MAG: SUMF1/EgtB/PvdO family nonheme iron enzyme [Polyangiaceae bacterium]